MSLQHNILVRQDTTEDQIVHTRSIIESGSEIEAINTVRFTISELNKGLLSVGICEELVCNLSAEAWHVELIFKRDSPRPGVPSTHLTLKHDFISIELGCPQVPLQ